MKTLVVDNTIDKPWKLCADIRRYLSGEIVVVRAPEGDLPRDTRGFTHVVLSGSKTSCTDESPWVHAEMDFIRKASDSGIAILGICFGHQLVARAFGAKEHVGQAKHPEFGWVEIKQQAGAGNAVLNGLSSSFISFQSHFEEVLSVPRGFIATATSDHCETQSIVMEGKPVFGIQFHPEKNADEGQESLSSRRGKLPNDCIFNDGRAKSVFDVKVAETIFRNFLAISK